LQRLKVVARKNSFCQPHQSDRHFKVGRLKNFTFVFSEIVFPYARPASARGAHRDRHDTRGGMRWTRGVAVREHDPDPEGREAQSV
jgi:hypothetical protein